eukprot:6324731-Amphidinium_carterae.1
MTSWLWHPCSTVPLLNSLLSHIDIIGHRPKGDLHILGVGADVTVPDLAQTIQMIPLVGTSKILHDAESSHNHQNMWLLQLDCRY